MRVLIVDDERLARKELRRLLKVHPGAEVVGEAANADEARAFLAEHRPDVVFLDVQMPGENGFELLESLETVPHVIFCTAYDEYALRAFDVNALDYLLKPVDPARLASAIQRAESQPSGAVPGDESVEPAPRTGPLHPDERVFVREGDRCWFVPVRSVRLLESEGNYTRLHFDEHRPAVFRSLNAMEERLSPETFFRANRAQVINLDFIEKIEPWFSGSYVVTLRGGERIELSRRQSQTFRARMSL
ncbi:MAG TPA: LytTR family DNA-binding domain-containing protein [Opitutaceae bacterium]|nr:LytTR family DNA-binding domain-containing protein [Opitutaceae bacterium]